MNHATRILLVALFLIGVATAAHGGKLSASDTKVVEKSWDELQQEIDKLENRVVVVNIWTTTCATCVEEFPAYAALSKKWTDDKVVFYDVNCDFDGIEGKPVGYYRDKVLAVLNKQKSDLRHVALTDPFIDFLEENKIHSTPTVLVYGPSGKLVKRFDNEDAYKEEDEFGADDVAALVQKLLERSPTQ